MTSVVDAFDRKHDAPEAQRVRRSDRRFELDQFWIAKLCQLKAPMPIWGPHHNDVDVDTFELVDVIHPRALDPRLAFDRHAERGEKSDSGGKVVDDDADVVQSLDRHVPSIAEAVRGGSSGAIRAHNASGNTSFAMAPSYMAPILLPWLLTRRFC